MKAEVDHLGGYDYRRDPNYRFSWNCRKEKAVARATLINLLATGLLKTIYEYFKFYLIFPAYYGLRRNQGITSDSSNPKVRLAEWRDNGFCELSLDQIALSSLIKIVNQEICDPFTVDTKGNPRFKFHLSKDNYPRLFETVIRGLSEAGAIQLARHTVKRRNLRLEEMYLFVQDTSRGWRDELPELLDGGGREGSRYVHVDSTPPNRVVKFIIYLNRVGPYNGPFQYLAGSHRVEKRQRAFIRRWIHHSRLQGMDEQSRRLFSLLPKFLQHKAEWGNDVQGSSLLFELTSVLGEAGTIALFDNSGSHRGGLISDGRRVSIHGGFR